jgi:hypothetical protein
MKNKEFKRKRNILNVMGGLFIMKTMYRYRVSRFRFVTKLHIAFTMGCLAMAIAALVCALFNPFHLLYFVGFAAIAIASYRERIW